METIQEVTDITKVGGAGDSDQLPAAGTGAEVRF